MRMMSKLLHKNKIKTKRKFNVYVDDHKQEFNPDRHKKNPIAMPCPRHGDA